MPRELISHPDKVFFAERGETKGDLAEHYQRVAEPLMRTMGGRPVLLQRFPDGASGPSFFQKRVPKNIPDWLQTTVVSTPNGTTSQALIATHIRRAAHEVHGLLTELGLAGRPKTTGNRGLHIYLRLQPRWDAYQVRAAAVALARELERRRPDLMTAAWWKEERGQRVFIDFNQNAPHKTVFGAWSVRARPGAQVSTPLAWDEIDHIHPDQFTIASLPDRLDTVGDPWAAMNDTPQDLAPLLDLAARDQENGLPDAPWPPVYPKQPGELSRVAPSRARKPGPADEKPGAEKPAAEK